jgi:hypothetical protein
MLNLFRHKKCVRADLSPGDDVSGTIWVHFNAKVSPPNSLEPPYLDLLTVCINRDRKIKQEVFDLSVMTECLADHISKDKCNKFESPFWPIDPLTRLVASCERRMIGEALRHIHGRPETTRVYYGLDGNLCSPRTPGAIPKEVSARFDGSFMPTIGRFFSSQSLRRKLDELLNDPTAEDPIIELGVVKHIAVFVRHTLEENCPISPLNKN